MHGHDTWGYSFVNFQFWFSILKYVMVFLVHFMVGLVRRREELGGGSGGSCGLELFSNGRTPASAAEVDAKFVLTCLGACAHFVFTATLQVIFRQMGGTASPSGGDALKQEETLYLQHGSITTMRWKMMVKLILILMIKSENDVPTRQRLLVQQPYEWWISRL